MRLHQGLGDRQSQPGTTAAAIPVRVHPIETVEYIRQVLICYACSCIFDGNDRPISPVLQSDLDRSPLGRMA